MKLHALLAYVTRLFSSFFVNGLLTLLPLALTVALFNTSFKLVLSWLTPVQKIAHMTFFAAIPYAEVLLSIIAILIVGMIAKVFIFRSVLEGVEQLISKVPLLRQIYAGIKQLVNAFSLQDKITFKEVVLVEFPRPGIYSLGFMTSELPTEIAPRNGELFVNVFIPTTPNPTSGFFVIMPAQQLIPIELTRQEAMTMIISGGIIQPHRFSKKE